MREALLSQLKAKKIKLYLNDGQLKVEAPKGVMTPEILQQIKAGKAELIEVLERINGQRTVITPVATREKYPLSHTQMRFWVNQQLNEDDLTYLISKVYGLHGLLSTERLEAAFQQVVEKYEVLRTVFGKEQDGTPYQKVMPFSKAHFPLQMADFSSDAAAESIAIKYIDQQLNTVFQLDALPLIRFGLVKVAKDVHHLYFSMHHIISDGWSMELFLQQLMDLYQGKPEEEPLKIQYKDFAAWQLELLEGKKGEEQRNFWLKQFEESIPVLDFPTQKVRPAIKSNDGRINSFQVPADLANQLFAYSRSKKGSLFTTLYAGLQAFLLRYTAQTRFVIGTPVAGRNHADLKHQIGPFINLLPLTGSVNPEASFSEIFATVKTYLEEAFSRQDYPFDHIVKALGQQRDVSRSPLFDVMFSVGEEFLGENRNDAVQETLSIRSLPIEHRVSRYDLTFHFAKSSDRLTLNIEYSTALFEAVFIKQIGQDLLQFLQALVANPAQPISTVAYLPPAKNAGLQLDSQDAQPESMLSLLEKQAQKTPEHTAVSRQREELTYAQLMEKAQQFSAYLQHNHTVQPGDCILVQLPRCPEMIWCILGILKSGGVYVPADPTYPQQRLDFMMADCNSKVLVDETCLQNFLERGNSDLWPIDFTAKPNDPAYMIYTSGTSGKPKGVILTHGNLATHARVIREKLEGHTEPVRMLNHASYSFDISLFELFMPLLSGGEVILLDRFDILETEVHEEVLPRLTHLHGVPSFFDQLFLSIAAENKRELLQHIQHIFIGGDAVSTAHLERIRQEMPQATIHELYGPTEGTIWCSSKTYPPAVSAFQGNVIGKAAIGHQLLVLDTHLQLVPNGVIGELFIGGGGVAKGYLNRETLHQERFIEHPYSAGERLYRTGDLCRVSTQGDLEFMGRKDDQIKLNGYRIEVREIEQVLQAYAGVEQAAVLLVEDEGGRSLVAYVASKQKLLAPKLRKHLLASLPEFMLPSQFKQVVRMPLSPNGKVDRKALEATSSMLSNDIDFVSPSTPEETLLVEVWKEVLRKSEISVKENFYNLGGDSIKSIQVVARLKQRGYTLKVEHLLRTPVLDELAHLLEIHTHLANQSAVTGAVNLTPIQQLFFEQTATQALHVNTQSVLLKRTGEINQQALENTIAVLIEHHDALRMIYRNERGVWQQENRDATVAAFTLEFHDLRQQDDELKALGDLGEQLHAGIHITNGPLFKAALFRMTDGDHLALVVHHLIIDTVSWRILLEDLSMLYEQCIEGLLFSLPLKSDSFQQWAAAQHAYAQDRKVLYERNYWQELCSRKVNTLAEIQPATNESFQLDQRVDFSLSEHLTAHLQSRVHRVYHTEINDLLLCGLSLAIKEVFGQEQTVLAMEGHGRTDSIGDADLSRTVGWFTTVYPHLLDLSGAESRSRSLINVKEDLRKIPGKGIGYGILQYLTDDFHASYTPSIAFNFLGDFGSEVGGKTGEAFVYSTAYFGPDPTIAAQNTASAPIEVSGMIVSGQLHLSLKYSGKLLTAEVMNQLGKVYQEELSALITTLEQSQRSFRTSSDFSFKGLTYEELAQLDPDDALVDIYRLSPLQEGIYFHWLSEKSSSLYFEQMAYTVKANHLDLDLIKAAYQKLIERHPVLRTSFTSDFAGVPLQLVHKTFPLHFAVESNEDSLSFESFRSTVERVKREELSKRFELNRTSQARLTIVPSNNGFYEFIWGFHHILMDGWCMSVLFKDFYGILSSLMKGEEVNLPTPPRYSDYINWLDQIDKQDSQNYWKQTLDGYTGGVELPFKCSQPGTGKYSEIKLRFTIEGARFDRINQVCQSLQITPNTFLQGSWGYLLSRYTNRQDVVFGAVVSGRPAELPGMENSIGLFINSIPVRVQYNWGDTVAQLLTKLQQQAIDGTPHHYLNLSDVQAQSTAGVNLIDQLFIFENYPVQELIFENLQNSGSAEDLRPEITAVDAFEQTNYDLNLVVGPGETSMTVDLKYNEEVFDNVFMKNMLKHLEDLLETFSTTPDLRLGQLSVLSGQEADKIAETNRTAADYPMDQSILELFAAQVKKNPKKRAVSCQGTDLTYQELDLLSRKFADFIQRDFSLQPNGLVVVSLPYDQHLLATLLAVLRLGSTYIPLDIETPKERVEAILQSNEGALLVDAKVLESMLVFEGAGQLQKNQGEQHNESFCVIYTSGSTGTPRGISISTTGILNRLNWMWQEYPFQPGEVCCAKTSLSFVDHICELFGPLLQGIPLVMIPKNRLLQIPELINSLEENQISRIVLVPSLLRELLRYPDECREKLIQLKLWISSGDTLRADDVRSFYAVFSPHATLLNIYGSTEVTADATCMDTSEAVAGLDDQSVVSIGKPLGNVRVHLLDEAMRPVPIGVPGEICVAGAGLSLGYVNEPELNQKFCQYGEERIFKTGDIGRWLPDGNIQFLGRMDDQLKIRGNRLELSEVTNKLLQKNGIQEAIVLPREQEAGDIELIAYFTAMEEMQGSELRTHLSQLLPAYMVPTHFVQLDQIPMNFSGKVDRKLLPEPKPLLKPVGENQSLPESAVEQLLVKIWEEVLAVPGIGANDNFFELGGHSLKATRIMARIQKEMGITIELMELFDDPTIRGLAKHIELSKLVIEQDVKEVEGGDELVF